MFKTVLMKFVYALGFLNTLVVSIMFWLFWAIPKYLQGSFEQITIRPDFLIVWDVANDSDFFKKSMKGWYGFVVGCNVVVVDYDKADPKYTQHMDHEAKGHGIQWYLFGLLFMPLYVLFTAFILVFLKNKHSYLDNPFERWARRVANQKVNIPREEWTDGPNDRFPWN